MLNLPDVEIKETFETIFLGAKMCNCYFLFLWVYYKLNFTNFSLI